MYTIYLITNTVNGKQYVGQTSKTADERWKNHVSSRNSSNTPLYQDIISFGTNAFRIEVLDYAETYRQAVHIEAQKMLELNTIAPNGYNLTTSTVGEGKRETCEETSKRLSEASKKRWAKMTKEDKQVQHDKMMAGFKARGYIPMHPNTRAALLKANKGRKMSDETRAKISASHSAMWDEKFPARPKIVEDRRIPVRCVETGECFDSTKQAAEAKGIKKSHNIGDCLRGKRKTAGGYHWEELPHEKFRESDKQFVRDYKRPVRKVNR